MNSNRAVTAIVVMLMAACGEVDTGSLEDLMQTTPPANPDARPAEPPPQALGPPGDAPLPPEIRIFNLGEKVKTPGPTVTIHSYLPNVPPADEYSRPEPGKIFSAIDVEGCATEGEASMNPLYFKLQMSDNTRSDVSFHAAKEPQLGSAQLVPGQCVRGWVTFDVPQGQKPIRVIMEDFNSVIQWNLP